MTSQNMANWSSYQYHHQNNTLDLTTSQIVILGIYCSIMTSLGLIGNCTVIYSTFRYKAIRLDRVSLLFVQNLAVADVLYTIFVILSATVTFLAGGWVLGVAWCDVGAQLGFTPAVANFLFVMYISLYRLFLVTHPFQAIKMRTARLGCGSSWSVAVAVPAAINGYFRTKGVFNSHIGTCKSSVYLKEEAKIVLAVATSLVVLIPLLVITLTNFVLCFIAARHSHRVKDKRRFKRGGKQKEQGGDHPPQRKHNKAVMMTCVLSGMLFASWLPYVVYNIMLTSHVDLPKVFEILAFNCIYINASVNPIIYTLANKRFGRYVGGLLRWILCFRAPQTISRWHSTADNL